jgi:hypothetical protein
MITLDFSFEAELWEYQGKGSWHFVTVPKGLSDDIKAFTNETVRGFRTVRVSVSLGQSTWLTSLFPDKKTGCYFLPVKADIRKAESLSAGHQVTIALEVFI